MFENISVDQLKNLSDINIIDIRSFSKYSNGHIFNAVNISYEELLLNYNKYLINGKKYYIYCQKGSKSMKLCSYLINKGYIVVNIIGGYDAWILNN